ncbi:hypothetical protein J6590_101315, partial [Homalodisca vitripennis]
LPEYERCQQKLTDIQDRRTETLNNYVSDSLNDSNFSFPSLSPLMSMVAIHP